MDARPYSRAQAARSQRPEQVPSPEFSWLSKLSRAFTSVKSRLQISSEIVKFLYKFETGLLRDQLIGGRHRLSGRALPCGQFLLDSIEILQGRLQLSQVVVRQPDLQLFPPDLVNLTPLDRQL